MKAGATHMGNTNLRTQEGVELGKTATATTNAYKGFGVWATGRLLRFRLRLLTLAFPLLPFRDLVEDSLPLVAQLAKGHCGGVPRGKAGHLQRRHGRHTGLTPNITEGRGNPLVGFQRPTNT